MCFRGHWFLRSGAGCGAGLLPGGALRIMLSIHHLSHGTLPCALSTACPCCPFLSARARRSGAGSGRRVPAGATAVLAVLETTDVHSNVLGYDYYKLAPDPSFGLDRTATLIAAARKEFANTLLLDNGDTIQGTALADYQALVAPLPCDQVLGIYKVMNQLGVEGGGIGNHEFNYGLGYLSQVTGSRFEVDGVDPARPRCAGPAFPQVLANVYSSKTHKQLFAPYRIIAKQVSALDANGKPVSATLKVGIIGFTPPTIVDWDKRWLDGKVYTEGIRETAMKYIPQMRAEGADLVIAISHGGLDDSPYSPTMENGNYHLSKVPGIDAMLIGHSHQVFPNAASTVAQFKLAGVDKAAGLVNGVPTTMANLWGKHLGVIGLHLKYDGAHWVVDKRQTTVEARGAQLADKSFVAADPAIAALVAAEHAATIAYVKTPVGASEYRMSSYFADVGDMSAIAVVNQAQADYVATLREGEPAAVCVAAGAVDGVGVQERLGRRQRFHRCAGRQPGAEQRGRLVPVSEFAVRGEGRRRRPEGVAGARGGALQYDRSGQGGGAGAGQSVASRAITSTRLRRAMSVTRSISRSPSGKRIGKLAYRGKPVEPAQQFIVATNNYRASGGGGFPGLDGSKTVLASPDANRDVLIAYIKASKQLTLAAHGRAAQLAFCEGEDGGAGGVPLGAGRDRAGAGGGIAQRVAAARR